VCIGTELLTVGGVLPSSLLEKHVVEGSQQQQYCGAGRGWGYDMLLGMCATLGSMRVLPCVCTWGKSGSKDSMPGSCGSEQKKRKHTKM
jgi:hypothetical protein